MGKLIGSALRRAEDEPLVRGTDAYVADVAVPGALEAAFARSPIAHGIIGSIDRDEAESTIGVVAVFTASDLAIPTIPNNLMWTPAAPGMDRSPLATGKVRYAGEPVALVVARSAAAAEDGASAVFVDLSPLPVVQDPLAAMAPEAPRIHDTESNVVYQIQTKTETSTETWPIIAEVEVTNGRVAPISLEPLGIVVDPRPDGGLSIWCSHQNPHGLRRQLASLFDLDLEQIRVRVPSVGGAFGFKGTLHPEYLALVSAALNLGRPIRWIQTRRDNLAAGGHGRGQVNRVRLEGDERGRIRRAVFENIADVGAYPHSGSFVPKSTHQMTGGVYDIAEIAVTTTVVTTNRAPTGPYRGAGRPEAAMAIERAIEVFARKANLDPIDVRMKNLIPSEMMPHRTPTGSLLDGGDYAAALRRAVELVDAPEVRAEQQRRRAAVTDPVGLGVALFVDRAGGGNLELGEFAHTSIAENGRVVLRIGSVDSGQGHRTVWRQIVGDALDAAPGDIDIIASDTSLVADGFGTFGSRSAQTGGSAAHRTAIRVRQRLLETAARLLEASPGDLRIREGRIGVAGVPGSQVAFADVAARAAADGTPLEAEEIFVPGAQTFPYGAYAAVVEVELDTGTVTVSKLVAVDDAGTVLNPAVFDGQVHGALVQGLGQALLEGIHYDDEGQLLTSTLLDYTLPLAENVPELVTDRMATPAPSNPLGVKGVGEGGCLGAPIAIVNAVQDALAPWGVGEIAMPLRPDRVWAAIHRPAG